MPLNFQDKQKIIIDIKEIANNALSMVVANFCGINVNKMTELRKEGRKVGVDIKVVRNSLLRRAIVGTNFECLKGMFIDSTVIAYSMHHPGSAARLFKEFSKTNTNLRIKAAAFEGKLIQASQIDYLALLPTYEEAIMRLIMTIKEASVGKLVRTLSAICISKKNSLP